MTLSRLPLRAQAELTLHPTKTRLVDAQEDGFDFLGYRFQAGRLNQSTCNAFMCSAFRDNTLNPCTSEVGVVWNVNSDHDNAPPMRGFCGRKPPR
jgi:hypothetical protein